MWLLIVIKPSLQVFAGSGQHVYVFLAQYKLKITTPGLNFPIRKGFF
jgi:hypothetical protein